MRMEAADMRIRILSVLACCAFLLQMLVIADWVDDVIEIVNQKMAPWHALLDKYDRALQTMESEERELTRIKQIIEKKIEVHQKKLKKLLLKVLGNTTFECKLR